MWRNLVARQLWELKVVGSNPTIPIICPCDETGKRAGLRNQILCVPFGNAYANNSHQGY